MGELKDRKTRLGNTLWMVFAAVVFTPFALIWGLGFLGFDPGLLTDIPAFGTWFMFALAAASVLAFVGQIVDSIKGRRVEWGGLLFFGAAAVWFVWLFLRQFN
jgi:hypothetical protein